jgi:membrane fusion protein (multidrug efflux system)
MTVDSVQLKIMSGWRIWIPLLLAAALAGYVIGQRAPSALPANSLPMPGDAAPPAAVVTAFPQRRTLADEIRAVGSLRAEESVLVSPEISGRVARVHFQEGQRVEAGAPLFDLDATELRAALEKSRAQETLDRLSFGRIENMRRRNLASAQQYDEAHARWLASRATVEQDAARLAKTRLAAPFAGLVGLRRVSVGEVVQPGMPLADLEALDRLKVDFKIPEEFAGRVRPGLGLDIAVDAFPGRSFSGEVYALDPRLDDQARSILLRGRLANPDGVLRPGMFARLTLVLSAGREALFIPEHAVTGLGSRQFVFVVEGSKAARREVKTGAHRDGAVEILDGLPADAAVVVDGQMKLRDGAPVTVTNGG